MQDVHQGAATRSKRILVPIDLSRCSKTALEYARFLSKRDGASITLLHVVEPLIYAAPDGAYGPFEEYANRRSEAALKEFLERDPAYSNPLTIEMEYGIPHDLVVRRAKEFDFVVMGTHGRTGFQHFVTGSVAARVVRRAPCPVMTVREDIGVHLNQINRILVPVDPTCPASATALAAALDWGKHYGADVEALHVWELPPSLAATMTPWTGISQTLEELSELIARRAQAALDEFVGSVDEYGPTKRLASGKPADVVVERAQAGDFDLIVISSHGSTGIARVFLGSVAEKVIRASPVPVLTLHAE